jgi:hypothetical protein
VGQLQLQRLVPLQVLVDPAAELREEALVLRVVRQVDREAAGGLDQGLDRRGGRGGLRARRGAPRGCGVVVAAGDPRLPRQARDR